MKQSEQNYNEYINPLVERYTSAEMNYIFSPNFKFSTWRKLWIALAESEMKLGLPITKAQVAEMKKHVSDIDYAFAAEREKELRHDVMAHVHTFAAVCPSAAGIIHLGATSAYVGDNTDLIQMKSGLSLIAEKILEVMNNLSACAVKYKDLPTLAFTHFQPAQLTTVGKRACLWIQELLFDYNDIVYYIDNMPFRGVKGTTGTQASFLELFEGNHAKVKKLDALITAAFGFKKNQSVTGQTYSRKIDFRVMTLLSAVSQSAAKFSADLRLLQHKKEMEEPFEKKQIGSSAMAYKRNPMRSERIGSLARFVMSLTDSTAYTSSTQWFERTLDDSANKRLALAQAFMAVDAILDIYINITKGMVVYEKMIKAHVAEELPFMMTENILMEAVKNGGNRQKLHERIRIHSMEAARRVKEEGLPNNLIELISADTCFGMTKEILSKLLNPAGLTGRSSEITSEFIKSKVMPLLKKHKKLTVSDLRV